MSTTTPAQVPTITSELTTEPTTTPAQVPTREPTSETTTTPAQVPTITSELTTETTTTPAQVPTTEPNNQTGGETLSNNAVDGVNDNAVDNAGVDDNATGGVVVLNEIEQFFSDNVAQCIPERVSRNKYVTQNLFIKHPQLFYADKFGENPNLTDSYLESKINELNFEWLSTTCHVGFLLRHPERIIWSAAALNENMPKDLLLAHEDQFDLRVCDNSNFDEAYFTSRITRGLSIDGNRLCMNKSISPEWLDKHGLLNWYWLGYNTGTDPQFFRDNYNKIKFSTYSYNKNADFLLIDRYIKQQTEQLKILQQQIATVAAMANTTPAQMPASEPANEPANEPASEPANEPHSVMHNAATEQKALFDEIKEDLMLSMEAACYNPAVPEWFLDKWCDLIIMEAVASNSGVSFEYLKANISRVPLDAMSYNSNVPLTWHKENSNNIVWHSLCMKLSKP